VRAAAAAGETILRLDLAVMGLGSDGHTASLFPSAIAPQEETQPVIATSGDYDARPAARVTLTPLAFNAARQITFLAAGAAKAASLAAVLTGPHDPARWPPQRIRPTDGAVTWLLDEAAAAAL